MSDNPLVVVGVSDAFLDALRAASPSAVSHIPIPVMPRDVSSSGATASLTRIEFTVTSDRVVSSDKLRFMAITGVIASAGGTVSSIFEPDQRQVRATSSTVTGSAPYMVTVKFDARLVSHLSQVSVRVFIEDTAGTGLSPYAGYCICTAEYDS